MSFEPRRSRVCTTPHPGPPRLHPCMAAQVWTYWRGNVSVDVDFDAMTIQHAAHAAT